MSTPRQVQRNLFSRFSEKHLSMGGTFAPDPGRRLEIIRGEARGRPRDLSSIAVERRRQMIERMLMD